MTKRPSRTKSAGLRFEIYTDYSGRFRWRLRASNLQIIADSALSYESSEAAIEAARQAKAVAPIAEISAESTRP